MTVIEDVQVRLRQFARERDWEQFHDPKNLLLALMGEVGELAELFRWLTPAAATQLMDSPEDADKVRDEMADVLIIAFRLADVLQIDLQAAIDRKIEKNEYRYPASEFRGSSRKSSIERLEP